MLGKLSGLGFDDISLLNIILAQREPCPQKNQCWINLIYHTSLYTPKYVETSVLQINQIISLPFYFFPLLFFYFSETTSRANLINTDMCFKVVTNFGDIKFSGFLLLCSWWLLVPYDVDPFNISISIESMYRLASNQWTRLHPLWWCL